MNYLKERNKMRMLLIGGFLLAMVVLFMLNSVHLGLYLASFNGLFLLAAISCYPLAIVYGRRQIVDVFNCIRMGERQPFRVRNFKSPMKPLYTLLNLLIAAVTIVFFGWIYGTYTAYQKLRMIKSFQIK
ncbi:hypothetical protein CSE16_19515 [Solibacillus sp. R5-41]|uniref:hypothetical protein n=1 Tax=Solibacillus sp. R5-41 TaxID=2048654 RepID=UPI000C1254A7|nr:hypothetical protein [Solibacillus sp. R5-41]ATP42032.1 hypothetical protein CSE16_19515 [Solibacillus sp. R5-41]